jgi:hypothetical protein
MDKITQSLIEQVRKAADGDVASSQALADAAELKVLVAKLKPLVQAAGPALKVLEELKHAFADAQPLVKKLEKLSNNDSTDKNLAERLQNQLDAYYDLEDNVPTSVTGR